MMGRGRGSAIIPIALFLGIALGVVVQNGCDLVARLDALRPHPAFAPAPALGEDVIPVEQQGRLALFVLAGQSNMSGRGEAPDPERDPSPRVYTFGNDYRWHGATEPVDDAMGQVDLVSVDADAGFGPALAFATALIERRPDMAVGLIPCARGGSSIAQWRRSLSDRTLYGSCLKRVRAASTMGEVAGLLFYQGEADAIDPALYGESELFPGDWGTRFAGLVVDWRADLGEPDLPVIYAQIGRQTAPEVLINWAVVREQQAAVELPRCTMIVTDDLALQDAVHLTPEGYRIVGERFAEAYLALVQGDE